MSEIHIRYEIFPRYTLDIQMISRIYPRDIHEIKCYIPESYVLPIICLRCTCDILEIYLRHTQNMPWIFMKNMRDIPKTCMSYTINVPEIFQRYTPDVQKIYPRYLLKIIVHDSLCWLSKIVLESCLG